MLRCPGLAASEGLSPTGAIQAVTICNGPLIQAPHYRQKYAGRVDVCFVFARASPPAIRNTGNLLPITLPTLRRD